MIARTGEAQLANGTRRAAVITALATRSVTVSMTAER